MSPKDILGEKVFADSKEKQKLLLDRTGMCSGERTVPVHAECLLPADTEANKGVCWGRQVLNSDQDDSDTHGVDGGKCVCQRRASWRQRHLSWAEKGA